MQDPLVGLDSISPYNDSYHSFISLTQNTGQDIEGPSDLDLNKHRHWFKVVAEASKCKFTDYSDRLIAISGVVEKVAYGDRYLAGLWRRELARGLQWAVTSSLGSSLKEKIGPSWSWVNSAVPVDTAQGVWMEYSADSLGKTYETFEVVDESCQITGPSPYGYVLSGRLRLKGFVARRKNVCSLYRRGDYMVYRPTLVEGPEAPPEYKLRLEDFEDFGVGQFDRSLLQHPQLAIFRYIVNKSHTATMFWPPPEWHVFTMINAPVESAGLIATVALPKFDHIKYATVANCTYFEAGYNVWEPSWSDKTTTRAFILQRTNSGVENEYRRIGFAIFMSVSPWEQKTHEATARNRKLRKMAPREVTEIVIV